MKQKREKYKLLKFRCINCERNVNTIFDIKKILHTKNIDDFIIFHPSAQYKYKIYPQKLRDQLLEFLSTLGISILVTGSTNNIDTEIKKTLPSLPNVYDFIGETTLSVLINKNFETLLAIDALKIFCVPTTLVLVTSVGLYSAIFTCLIAAA